ncbi:hypothetical protein GQ44DRAFT_145383 [Phaeosphaeriaceae sp. PMI808]|nr:hypothetical protein GQ44DRAFT_145383 [Phaeosphaeriaceae sp. PMI808]
MAVPAHKLTPQPASTIALSYHEIRPKPICTSLYTDLQNSQYLKTNCSPKSVQRNMTVHAMRGS